MNRARVQELRNVIAGIPGERIALSEVFKGDRTGTDEEAPKPCGAVACMAGWAWIYPPFVEAGIRECHDFPADAAPIFLEVCWTVFFSRRDGEFGTHKEIALRRLDKLLEQS